MNSSFYSIREIAIGVFDGPHATPDLHDDGVAVFLGINNLTDTGSINLSGARYVSEADYPRWTKRVTPQEDDVVFTYEATLNRYAIIPKGFKCCLGRRTALIRPEKEKIDHRFLFYYFFTPEWRKQIEANVLIGATVDRIPLTKFPEFKVRVPSRAIQTQIADVLSAYDELIAANQRRIQLLEESTQLLYREWFVKLRFPEHETVPVKDGVPEGWEQRSIASLCTFLNRGITPQYNDVGKGLVINQKCIRAGRLSLEQARRHSKEVKSERLVQLGDILVNSTGAGTLGRVAPVLKNIPECTVDTHITIARPRGELEKAFFGLALLNLEAIFSEMGKGATNQLELSRNDIGNIKILVPNREVQKNFEQLAWPLLEQAQQIADSNELLEEAREMLLPRLMSGALDVSRIAVPQEVEG